MLNKISKEVYDLSKYHVGDKFIIEIDKMLDGSTDDTALYHIKGFNSLVFDAYGLDKLKPYKVIVPSADSAAVAEFEAFFLEAYNAGIEVHLYITTHNGHTESRFSINQCHIIDQGQEDASILFDNGVIKQVCPIKDLVMLRHTLGGIDRMYKYDRWITEDRIVRITFTQIETAAYG